MSCPFCSDGWMGWNDEVAFSVGVMRPFYEHGYGCDEGAEGDIDSGWLLHGWMRWKDELPFFVQMVGEKGTMSWLLAL